jgi:hypothetical protein
VIPTLEAIVRMDRAALVAVWSDRFGGAVPRSLSQPYLRRFLAFEVQSQHAGALPKGFVARIEAAARGQGARRPTGEPKPGGRLMREWNGTTHVVEIAQDGYVWNGARYRSLSAIARDITGARWSGPRFFGLRGSTGR